jgi:uncharacterized cupin superfamily protein
MKQCLDSTTLAWELREGPGNYSVERKHLTPHADTCNLGCSRYRLNPGKKAFPAHHHYGNDEAIYVLSGDLTVIQNGQPQTVNTGGYLTFARGNGIAHSIENRSDKSVEFLCFSTMNDTDVITYPHSGKIGVFGGTAPGGSEKVHSIKEWVPRSPVDYWDGEGQ